MNATRPAVLMIAALTVLMLWSCSDSDNDHSSEPATPATLTKWPADYPISGDSVVVMSVTIADRPIGDIWIELYPDSAPNHVRNFKWLTDHGFYDNLTFHRVISGFMIQGGDPTGTGSGGPGWTFYAEFNRISHVRGVVSMARTQDPNSAGSQFFIMHAAGPHLDRQYSAFGRVIAGMAVVDTVAATPVGGPQGSTPVQPVVMSSVRIVARPDSL
jgi:cyclophilin family peptidyl-prolyl cis-trans isomerase